MKKIFLVMLFLLFTSLLLACDGSCRCGGVPVPTDTQSLTSSVVEVGKWCGYFFGGAVIAAEGIPAAFISVPVLFIYLSRDQRVYNAKHGIMHSREGRRK